MPGLTIFAVLNRTWPRRPAEMAMKDIHIAKFKARLLDAVNQHFAVNLRAGAQKRS